MAAVSRWLWLHLSGARKQVCEMVWVTGEHERKVVYNHERWRKQQFSVKLSNHLQRKPKHLCKLRPSGGGCSVAL